MSSGFRISPRERLVLISIIEAYIATGEPVASQAIARIFADKDGLSSATIRNVMASLGDAGLLDQPHSSAGRVPTPQAFRLYVELLGLAPQQQLGPERRAEIEASYLGVSNSQQFLERTSQVLAAITRGVGIAISAAAVAHELEHIHFSRLGAQRVLAVLVTRAGVVLDRVLSLDREMEYAELENAARFLNENFRGWPVERVRAELLRRIEEERSEYDRLLESLEALCQKGALESAAPAQTVYIGGVANLLASEPDRVLLGQMLAALEAKQRLIALLNAYVDARQQTVRVQVGLEDSMPEMSHFVLIGAPAIHLGVHAGSVAVLAPTRIQYQDTINAVSFIAQLSDRILQLPQ
jgi:heat-inducible transcriptional repressor